MCLQHGTHCPCLFHSRQHPQGMTEDVAVFLIGKRITTLLVLFGYKIQESTYILVMNKSSTVIYTEELTEIECHIFVNKLIEQSSEVIGVNVHGRQ